MATPKFEKFENEQGYVSPAEISAKAQEMLDKRRGRAVMNSVFQF